jgi:hypothetical protein
MLLGACGGTSGGSEGAPPAAPDEVVLRVVTRGGFGAESRQPAQLPRLSVYGDGRVIVAGPTTLEYPGPALPNLQEFRLTREGLARVVDDAREAGLLDDPPPDYGEPGVTDQATTTVTVRVDGRTRRVEVYALGFKGRVSGVKPEQRERRRRLEQLIDRAGDADAQRPVVEPGSERRYEPTAVAVLVRPSDSTDGDVHAWPLGDLTGTDCLVLSGDDVATAVAAARTARAGDRWTSAGATYDLDFRPLLPDERSCDDVGRP